MPLPLHQIADPALTAPMVLATFAATDGECSFDEARQIAERCNQHGGNLTRACPGWHQPLYHPFLAYSNALLCERDPAELAAWLTTCAGDCERRGNHDKAADYRRRAAEVGHNILLSQLEGSVALIGAVG